MKIYLAGGAVRDLLLGRTVRDKDYLVLGATHKEFIEKYPQAQQVGKAFPVYLVDGHEYAFPRADTLEQELLARDLTINAMLMSDDGELVCHPHALEDLNNHILRPASDDSIALDPLRVFRAARFAAMLPDFTAHNNLIQAMRAASESGTLKTLSADRIGQELRKACQCPNPGHFLRLLAQGDCLSPWLKEFDLEQGERLEHTAGIMDKSGGRELVVWMALCHTLTTSGQAKELGDRLRMPVKYIKAGTCAATLHADAGSYPALSPDRKVDLLMAAHKANIFKQLFILAVVIHGQNHFKTAYDDLNSILKVKLPEDLMNRGKESGRELKKLQTEKIIKHDIK